MVVLVTIHNLLISNPFRLTKWGELTLTLTLALAVTVTLTLTKTVFVTVTLTRTKTVFEGTLQTRRACGQVLEVR